MPAQARSKAACAYPARDDMAVVGFVAITLVKRTDHEPLD